MEGQPTLQHGYSAYNLSQTLTYYNIFSETDELNKKLYERDYIVEEGVGYRKWNSGLLEQWMNMSVSWTISNAYGTLYQGTYDWIYPQEFKQVDFVICAKAQHSTGASWGTVYDIHTNYVTLRAFDVVARTSGSGMRAIAYARGKWK